jgi:vanillate O-demethylase ferredoxin subunit
VTLRRKLLPVHRWTGLTVGLILLLSALTGAGLTFRKQLDPFIYPGLVQRSQCLGKASVDPMINSAISLHPRGKIDFVRILRDPQLPVTVRFLDKDTYYFDRCSGRLLGQQNRYGGVFGTMEWLHRGRWLPFGDWVMGSGALAMLFVLAGIGIFLWWPRRPRRLRDGFRLNRKLKGPAFLNGLHRTVGAWIAVPLAVSALTALPNAFDFIHAALDGIGSDTGGTNEPRFPIIAARPVSGPINAIVGEIGAIAPQASEMVIHMSEKPGARLKTYVIEAGAPHANARTFIDFDASSGRVLRYAPYASMGLGGRIYYWMLSAHTGALGLLNQVIIFAGAAGALVLGYTGIWLYLGRKLKSRAARSPRTAARACPPGRDISSLG